MVDRDEINDFLYDQIDISIETTGNYPEKDDLIKRASKKFRDATDEEINDYVTTALDAERSANFSEGILRTKPEEDIELDYGIDIDEVYDFFDDYIEFYQSTNGEFPPIKRVIDQGKSRWPGIPKEAYVKYAKIALKVQKEK